MHQVECGFVNQIQNLVQFGPTLRVQIGFDPSYRSTDNPAPNLPSNLYPALIDTGAAVSCIDSRIAANLGLPTIDEQPISGALGSAKVNVHLAQIHVSRITVYNNWTILWSPFACRRPASRRAIGTGFPSPYEDDLCW